MEQHSKNLQPFKICTFIELDGFTAILFYALGSSCRCSLLSFASRFSNLLNFNRFGLCVCVSSNFRLQRIERLLRKITVALALAMRLSIFYVMLV